MIAREQLAVLAELYDRYQHSLRPLAPERAEAGRAFSALLERLHAAHAPDVAFDDFRRETIVRCREYLRRNRAP